MRGRVSALPASLRAALTGVAGLPKPAPDLETASEEPEGSGEASEESEEMEMSEQSESDEGAASQ